MDDGQQLLLTFDAKFERYMRNFERAQQQTDQRFRAMEQRAKVSAGRLESSFAAMSTRIGANLKGIGASFLAGFSIQGAQKLIDQATRIQNALKVAGLSGNDLTNVYGRLFDAAQKNAAPLETLVGLYSKVALVQKELGVSQQELLQFTDNVSLALRVAGTDAQSAGGALLQLSQALGSGTVRAEEFNSVLEGAPTIAQAVAAGMKEAGGSVAALRTLVIDGKVSSEAFFRSFEAGAGILRDKVAGSELTVSQAFVRLQNVLIDVATRFNDSTDASRILVNIIENHLTPALQEVGNIFTGLSHGPIADFIAYVGKATDAVLQLSADFGAMTGLDEIGRKFGAKPFVSQDRIQDRINGAFDGIAATKGDRIPAEVTVTKPAEVVKPISLADYAAPAGKAAGRGSRAKSGGNDFEREIAQTQRRIATLQAETAAQAGLDPLIDDYGRAVEAVRIKQELLNAAQQAGVAITPEVAAKIDQLANSYADASVASRQLAEQQDKTRQSAEDFAGLGKDVLGGFISDLRSGKSAAEALANALNKVVDKLLDMALNSLFSSSGGGGMLGGLFSFLGFKDGGLVQAFADGGHVRGPGGPRSDKVPAWLSAGEYVINSASTAKHRALVEAINSDSLPALASGGSLNGGGVDRLHRAANDNVVNTWNMPVSVTVNAQGGDPAQNADLARQTARQTQDAVRAVVISELQTQMRPGGIMSGRGRY